MFEYLYYLVEKFLALFSKNKEAKPNNELTKLILDNKQHLKDIISIRDDYTIEGLLEILKNELKILKLRMDNTIECEELTFEDIEKRTFLDDIVKQLEEMKSADK